MTRISSERSSWCYNTEMMCTDPRVPGGLYMSSRNSSPTLGFRGAAAPSSDPILGKKHESTANRAWANESKRYVYLDAK